MREYEWFEMETKIRKFVNELLQPIVRKSAEENKIIEDVEIQIERNNSQVNELYEIIHFNDKKVKVIDDIYEKLFL